MVFRYTLSYVCCGQYRNNVSLNGANKNANGKPNYLRYDPSQNPCSRKQKNNLG